MEKIGIILFNLGGPSKLDEVPNFLFNLFYDEHIIRLPKPFRYLLAKFITFFRKDKSSKIYSAIGGKSPILEITNMQAAKLEIAIKKAAENNLDFKTFVVMSYSYPQLEDQIDEIKNSEHNIF